MAGKDEFSAHTLAEQWLFDYYVEKCVSKSSESGEMDDSSKRILEALMPQSIDPDYGMNRVKANMLIVMDYQLQLAELDIDNPESKGRMLLESEESLTEFMELIDGLRSSLLSLKEREELESSSLCALCNTCLIHTYVYVFQVLCHLRNASDPLFDVSQLESWMNKILKKAGKEIDSASEKDKTFLKICQDLLEKQGSAAKKDLPRLQDLISLLSKLVKKIQAGFPKPHILKQAESYVRLQSKLEEIGSEDLLSVGPSPKSSLERLALLNKSKSADDGRSRKGQKGQSSEKSEESLQSINSSVSEASDSEASVSSPRKDRRNKKGRSRSPVKKPDVLKVVLPSKKVDSAGGSKPRKPASHARVKLGPWTPAEEETFVISVLQIGVGKWAEIKEDIQAERSTVQLKDKWRNIPKSRVKSIAHQYGLPTRSK